MRHLSKRFFQSLFAGRTGTTDLLWVESILSPAEMRLWDKQNRADKKHSIIAGRYVESQLGERKNLITAAIMHDVGKIDTRLSLMGRVVATLIRRFVPKNVRSKFVKTSGLRGQYCRYWLHNEIGADYLRAANSDQVVVDWALQHNQPRKGRTIDNEYAEILARSDQQ